MLFQNVDETIFCVDKQMPMKKIIHRVYYMPLKFGPYLQALRRALQCLRV